MKSKEIQEAQFNAQTLLGREVWRLTLPVIDSYNKLFPQKNFASNDWLINHLTSRSSLTVVKAGQSVIGHPTSSGKQSVLNQLFTSGRMGLPIYTEQGLPACVLLNIQNQLDRIGSIWIISEGFRCEVIPPPKNWLALYSVSDMPSLVLHAAHLHARLGSQFTTNVDWVIIEKSEECLKIQTLSQLPVICQALAVTRSADAKASKMVIDTQIKFTQVALVSTALTYIIYLYGFFPLLYVEAAIRVALGYERKAIYKWLWSELILQSVLAIILPLILLGSAVIFGLELPMAYTMLMYWLICLAYILVTSIILTIKKLPQSIANLGKAV